MTLPNRIASGVSSWIGTVAQTLGDLAERFRARGVVEVVEEGGGAFTMRLAGAAMHKGRPLDPLRLRMIAGEFAEPVPPAWTQAARNARVALTLHPSRFLVRPLELPKRASEFLDGIVRSQIDRLTPWAAAEAVFACLPPREIAGERIVTTIAATERAGLHRLAETFARLGARIVEVSTQVTDPQAETTQPMRVQVHAHRAGGASGQAGLQRALTAIFLVTGFAALSSLIAAGFIGPHLDDEKAQIQRRISALRAELRAGQTGAGASAADLLARRKHTSPSSVIVLDALSGLLPDHTHASELRIEGDKVQVVGITRDAPSLIGLLEQSSHFTRAIFFAPTTRAPNDTGERFHIEARIRPHFGPGP